MHLDSDTLVYFGGAVKALGDGRVGGHLVLFSGPGDPDLTGEYFTARTDFKLSRSDRPALLYEHAMDGTLGDREIGEAKARMDGDVGVWLEAQLSLRDEYEKAIYRMCQEGKLGWSSGTAGHLVRKKQVGKSVEILSWPIVEASLTPHPAEPRTSAVPLKSLYPGGVVAAPPSFDERSSGLVAGLTEFRDLASKFRDQRTKAGRVLSAANRGRIASVVESIRPMLLDLEALLAETDPTPPASGFEAEAEAGTDTLARAKALRLAVLRRQIQMRTT